MVRETKIKAYPREDRGGWVIYLPKKLVEDSSFPFKPGIELVAIIEKNKLIIKKSG